MRIWNSAGYDHEKESLSHQERETNPETEHALFCQQKGGTPEKTPGTGQKPEFVEEYEGEESPLEPEDISDAPEYEKRPLPIEQTDAIFAFGRISLTSGVISFFSKYSVPIHFFGYYGHYESDAHPEGFTALR